MGKQAMTDLPVSDGVNDLIARLRDKGVAAGEAEGAAIIAQAKAEADAIRQKAKKKADAALAASKKASDAYVKAGEDALQAAIRDAVIEMKSGLMEQFSTDVQRLISYEMKEPEFLRQMILELVGRVQESAGLEREDALEVILPQSVMGLDALRQDTEELENGEMTQFVRGLTGQMMQDGVTFRASPDSGEGVQISVQDKNVIVDVSDKAVAGLLLRHLQPRFRAILEGVVK